MANVLLAWSLVFRLSPDCDVKPRLPLESPAGLSVWLLVCLYRSHLLVPLSPCHPHDMMHTWPPAWGPQGQAGGQEHSHGWEPAALCPPCPSLAHSRGLSALAPGAVRVPILHQAVLPQRSFTADRAEVRAERVDA